MSSVMAREAARRTPKTAELEAYLRKYPDVHREVIVKEDILNCGFKYTDAALERAAGAQTKMYHLFSYDRITVADMDKREEAIKTFYAALNADQKNVFDTEHARMGHHPGDRRGPGGMGAGPAAAK